MNVESSVKQSSFSVIMINQMVILQQGHPKARAIKKPASFCGFCFVFIFIYSQ